MILWPHVQLKDDTEPTSNQPTLLLIRLYMTKNPQSQKRKDKDLAIHLDLPREMTCRVRLPSKDITSSTTFTPLWLSLVSQFNLSEQPWCPESKRKKGFTVSFIWPTGWGERTGFEIKTTDKFLTAENLSDPCACMMCNSVYTILQIVFFQANLVCLFLHASINKVNVFYRLHSALSHFVIKEHWKQNKVTFKTSRLHPSDIFTTERFINWMDELLWRW